FDVRARTPEIARLIVGGPYDPTGRGETPSRRNIFICRPNRTAQEAACARSILTNLAHRAFRRPVMSADVQPLLAFFQQRRLSGDFDAAIQAAIEAMLVSPEFLFRIERDPSSTRAAAAAYPVSDVELASRLSFFLWST